MMNSFSRYRSLAVDVAGPFSAGGLACAAIAAGATGHASLEHAGMVVLAAAAVIAARGARRAKKTWAALSAIEATCKRIAEGDFEARIIGVDHASACAGAENAVNDAIDRCDAFVREATASLDAVCRGVYYRFILREGLNGAFRVAAESINASVKGYARAVAEARKAAEAEKNLVVETIGTGLAQLAAKDLSARIGDELPQAYARVRADFNSTVDAIESAMRHVRASADAIASGAAEIATASSDLARRTEQQAANLEKSTAALREVAEVVNATARSSSQTHDHISAAKSDAGASIEVVQKTIAAVTGITELSKKIGAAVGVIDEIAFQTNLLALNAGVEAARAGEAGRGFAVVASEVRALAQRSAQAAKEIKGLIAQASGSVETGVGSMAETAAAFNRIKEQISMIDGCIADIAAKSLDQSTTIKEVNLSISGIDHATQQNAAMAEEATAACKSLADESGRLARMVGAFTLSVVAHDPSLAEDAAAPSTDRRAARVFIPLFTRTPIAGQLAPCPYRTPPHRPFSPNHRHRPQTRKQSEPLRIICSRPSSATCIGPLCKRAPSPWLSRHVRRPTPAGPSGLGVTGSAIIARSCAWRFCSETTWD